MDIPIITMIMMSCLLFPAWQPYPASNASCGSDYITGVGGEITTPGYPYPFKPNLACTWMIRVQYDKLILLNMLELDLGTNGMIPPPPPPPPKGACTSFGSGIMSSYCSTYLG